MSPNPCRDIYRHHWPDKSRYPPESKAQIIERLTEAAKDEYVGKAASKELQRVMGIGKKSKNLRSV